MSDTLQNQLWLEGTLRTVTAIRIGSAQMVALHNGAPLLRNALGQPFIPGSTVKGALRAHLAAILETLLGTDETASWLEPVFGARHLAGRVQIDDLPLVTETGTAGIHLRQGLSVHRHTRTMIPNSRYQYEIVPPETVFSFRLVAENLKDAQFGLLLVGLHALKRGELTLGGFKNRGLGRVKLDVTDRRWFEYDGQPQTLLHFLQHGSPADEIPAEIEQRWLAAFHTEIAGVARRRRNDA
ncbi:MAG: hypothetical protein D6675_06250 [Gemmatimonadetes bacterium]|nr:MAG: hypothetical protein D6675_06250 [Gemmatimonadota bacterium]